MNNIVPVVGTHNIIILDDIVEEEEHEVVMIPAKVYYAMPPMED